MFLLRPQIPAYFLPLILTIASGFAQPIEILIPRAAQDAQRATGLAFANPSNQFADLHLQFLDESGLPWPPPPDARRRAFPPRAARTTAPPAAVAATGRSRSAPWPRSRRDGWSPHRGFRAVWSRATDPPPGAGARRAPGLTRLRSAAGLLRDILCRGFLHLRGNIRQTAG